MQTEIGNTITFLKRTATMSPLFSRVCSRVCILQLALPTFLPVFASNIVAITTVCCHCGVLVTLLPKIVVSFSPLNILVRLGLTSSAVGGLGGDQVVCDVLHLHTRHSLNWFENSFVSVICTVSNMSSSVLMITTVCRSTWGLGICTCIHFNPHDLYDLAILAMSLNLQKLWFVFFVL